MSDLKFLMYAQLIIFAGFLISAILLIGIIIRDKFNQDK